eukprot:TRINITY_DN275_c1_g2_i4.p1 TRINITY_DN275_c1_g2~~TRINITY_DN275_c1_g2_i4.p1  ORF type:complete len:343 (-),score=83.28 TRINITY_DN275_c1_g2_i4:483-1511(-)
MFWSKKDAAPAAADGLSDRLASLNQCHKEGLIDKAEFDKLRKECLNAFVHLPTAAPTASPRTHDNDHHIIMPDPVMVQGFSIEEAMHFADEGQKAAMARSPKEVLADLQKGNARFWTGEAFRPEKNAFERRALIGKQFPCVALVGCADSRVPVEIVFDQGLGDIFTVRNAGNCVGTSAMASLQYAVHNLKVKVIVVMGHEGCGAVKAACSPLSAFEAFPGELSSWLHKVREGIDVNRVGLVRDERAKDREAVVMNVRHQVARLSHDAGIMEKVRKDELVIIGAFYELSSGIVDFFEPLTDETPSSRVATLRRQKTNPGSFHLNLDTMKEGEGDAATAAGEGK